MKNLLTLLNGEANLGCQLRTNKVYLHFEQLGDDHL